MKESDVALSFLLSAPLPIDTALNMAKIKMLMATEFNEDKKEEYRDLLNPKNHYKLASKIGRPAGRGRERLYGLIPKYLKEVATETKDKRKKQYRLSVDYYFDEFKPHYSEELKAIIRKFFSEPETSYWLFHSFNYDWSFYPIVTVDELIETIIQTSLWFYERIAYILYIYILTRGFVDLYPHNEGNEGHDNCNRSDCPLNGKKYHFHNLRKEHSEEIKNTLKKIISDKFDNETIEAAGKVIALSLYYKKCPQYDVTLLKNHPYKYYFVLGRLLAKKGLQNDSYQFNHTMALAEDLRPRSGKEKITTCPKCKEERMPTFTWRDYCENCKEFATDKELGVDEELMKLLDKLYLDEGMKRIIKSNREAIEKDKKIR